MSVWTSQMALVRIVAKLSNGETIVLWENENVNSPYGHLPCRHIGGQKEEQGQFQLFILIERN